MYALGRLARLEAGERVLIHGGAGGVGLAAIQYALQKGAVVYATAGSPLRRQALRMLGVSGVFDSRSAGFIDDVLTATGGEGVDVVLNSLSGELMKQSVRLLRPFGRFLEIGKRDLYRNSPVGIRSFRHNASYFAIDTDELVGRRPAVGQAVLDEVAALLEAGCLQPLPYRAFGFSEVVDAFRLLQSSGHVGKVVLLPEPTPPASAKDDFAADPDGVYLVTGGLSGFGLEAARWLARHGARHLALLSRRGEASPDAEAILAGFAAAGVDARAYACDVADEAQLQRMLAGLRGAQGSLRGVLHAAMVLDDAKMAELDASRFAAVIRPKLAGAAALDLLTRDDPLDLFVLFSSVTTVIGTPGQANYVAANAALETLAERRHAAGLPALAVLWGPIGDAGYLARETRVAGMLAKMLGSSHMRAERALDALPALLACGRPCGWVRRRCLGRIARAAAGTGGAVLVGDARLRAYRRNRRDVPGAVGRTEQRGSRRGGAGSAGRGGFGDPEADAVGHRRGSADPRIWRRFVDGRGVADRAGGQAGRAVALAGTVRRQHVADHGAAAACGDACRGSGGAG